MENCACLKNTVNTIIKLQKESQCGNCNLETCDRPYLGNQPNNCLFNTRPVTFYCCPSGNLFTMPYTLNEIEATSNTFRCESADGCCCTCRILAPNPDETSIYPYISTNSFFTINLNCVGAIKCLPDTYISCL